MKRRFLHLTILVVTLLTACAPTVPATPTVDVIGTRSAELASMMMTQTVEAYSPTPPPSPTFTVTPAFTETPTLEPTPAVTAIPMVNKQAPCYTGPGPTYTLTSYISGAKNVEIIAVGSVPGWYVITNPYFYTQCWIAAEDLDLDPNFDPSVYPTMTP